MKRIFLTTACLLALSAPAFALDDGTAFGGAPTAAERAATSNVQTGQPAQASGDIFLRGGDNTRTVGTDSYLRSGPINMTPGATRGYDTTDAASQQAAAQVYDPEAPKKDGTMPVATNAPDYSAQSYNSVQTGATNASFTTTSQSSGGIASPFPSWFAGYHAPSLDSLKRQAYQSAAMYARAAEPAQQQAPKRTTAFGTTSQLKAANQ